MFAGHDYYGLWLIGMKITLEIPDELARKFKATVPNGRRSKLIAELLERRLRAGDSPLESAARKANTFRVLNREMKDWEALSSETSFNDSHPNEK